MTRARSCCCSAFRRWCWASSPRSWGWALGDVLSHALFQRAPDFLSAAFPIGAEEVVHASTVLIAVACGVLATALASLSPLLDLRASRPADAVFREAGGGSEIVGQRTIARFAYAGLALIVLVVAIVLLAPGVDDPRRGGAGARAACA